MWEISVYIHWPFCRKKCPYCDFNSHVRDSIDYDTLLFAYLNEIDYYRPLLNGKTIKTVFLGGGTPSLAKPAFIEKLLNKLFSISNPNKNIEITIECNPTSFDIDNLLLLKECGINRVSLGIQSLNDKNLKFLGREHTVRQGLEAIQKVKKHFDNYSFDLIYALPDQSLQEWENELKSALEYTDKHASLYQLTIEPNTHFATLYNVGKLKPKLDDDAADFYEMTEMIMKNAGFNTYEISNYAKPGFECQHNLVYWRYQDYIGIGPGAHGRYTAIHNDYSKIATQNHKLPETWMRYVSRNGHGMEKVSELEEKQMIEEKLLMNLRLKEGMILGNLISVGCNEKNIFKLIELGLLKLSQDDKVTYTTKGALVLNKIIEYLCP